MMRALFEWWGVSDAQLLSSAWMSSGIITKYDECDMKSQMDVESCIFNEYEYEKYTFAI